MKRILLVAIFIIVSFTGLPAAASVDNLAGTWVGGYETDGIWTFIKVDIRGDSAGYRGVIDLGGDHDRGRILSFADLDEAGRFSMSWGDTTVEARFIGDRIEGEKSNLALKRIAELSFDSFRPYMGNYAFDDGRIILLLSARDEGRFIYHDTLEHREVVIYPLSDTTFFSESGEEIVLRNGTGISFTGRDGETKTARRTFTYDVEEVRYPSGALNLAGTLLLPKTEGPFPAVVLMHPTGPNNREYFRQWGHYFAEAGIAVLVYDKPGAFDSSHPSLPSFRYNSVQNLADAALAGIRYLQTRPEINAEQVGIWSYSNSSWAGPLAASQSDSVAFLIATAVSGVPGSQAQAFQENLNNMLLYNYPKWAADSSLRYVQFSYEFSLWAGEWNLPFSPPVRDYWGLDYDPISAWQQIDQPVLLLNGELDTLVDPVDAVARIQSALEYGENTDYTLVVVPNADHRLQLSDTGLIDERLGRHEMVFAPDIFETMTGWILERFNGAETTIQTKSMISSPRAVEISRHFEQGGLYALLPWYGQPEVQVFLTLILFLVPFIVALIMPVKMFIKMARRRTPVRELVSFEMASLWGMSVLMLLVMGMLVVTWLQVAVFYIGELDEFPSYLNIMPVAGYLSIPAVAISGFYSIRHWRIESGIKDKILSSLLTIVGILFVMFIVYWRVIG